MSLLQKVSRYVELSDMLAQAVGSVETESLGGVNTRCEGIVDELMAVRAITGDARRTAVATPVPAAKVAKKKATVSSKATSVSDTAGRGKKQCPGCQKFVGARAQTCPNCKHIFETAVTKPANTSAATTPNSEKTQGRRAKGESLSNKLVEVLQDAANDGRRKEPSLDLAEVMEKLIAKGYKSTAKEKNFRVSVQARLGDLVKKGVVLKSQDRKYSVKVATQDAAPAATPAPAAQSA